MSVSFYDKAVKEKIKSLFKNTEFQSRELAFKTITDRAGEVKFPFISIFRPDGWSLSSKNTWIENREFLGDLRQVYVDLSYSIDIYANTREELESITAELVLYLLRNPGIIVHYESANGAEAFDVKTSLKWVSGPERTSELDDETKGRPYRYTLVYELENAAIYAFASDNPDSPNYKGSKVTVVLTDVITDVQYLVSVDSGGDTNVVVYEDKEVVIK